MSGRLKLLFVYLAIFAGLVLYHYVIKGTYAANSAALFIGLPALLAILVAQIPTKSVTGHLMLGLTLLLLLAVPVLREGTVCVIMAAPLMYGVVGVIGLIIDYVASRSNRLKASVVAAVVATVFSLEGVTDATTFNREEEIVTSRIIAGEPATVMARYTVDPVIPTELPAFFEIGFPRPYEFSKDGTTIGSHYNLSFIKNEKVKTISYALTEATPDKLVFTVAEDHTALTKWLYLRQTTMTFTPTGDGNTEVSIAIAYERKLDPAWYFAPITRYSIRLVGDMLLDHFDAEPALVGSL